MARLGVLAVGCMRGEAALLKRKRGTECPQKNKTIPHGGWVGQAVGGGDFAT